MATASTRSTPTPRRKDANTAAVWIARSIGSGLSTPSSPIPALTRVASRISSARLHQLPGSYWKTTSRNEFEPMSMTATRSIAADDAVASESPAAAMPTVRRPSCARAGLAADTPEHPLRVAIVGSGPAGFYAAGHLLNAKDATVEVDMFDRLPTPFGLVRAGVAPDHPKIKSVTRVYEKTAAKDGFRFFGNVEVGEDITHAELEERYHAVIYAVRRRRPTATWASRARTCPAAGPPPSSSPGTTATPTTATSSSTSPASARW